MNNYLTGGQLNRDRRGRVRFTHEGMRYEVTKTGMVNAYERHNIFGESPLPLRQNFDPTDLNLLRTMANAIALATEVTSVDSFEIAGMS